MHQILQKGCSAQVGMISMAIGKISNIQTTNISGGADVPQGKQKLLGRENGRGNCRQNFLNNCPTAIIVYFDKLLIVFPKQ